MHFLSQMGRAMVVATLAMEVVDLVVVALPSLEVSDCNKHHPSTQLLTTNRLHTVRGQQFPHSWWYDRWFQCRARWFLCWHPLQLLRSWKNRVPVVPFDPSR